MALGEQLSLGLADVSDAEPWSAADPPDGWRLCRLDTICTVNPSRKGQMNHADGLTVTFVPMSAVDEMTGTITTPEMRPFGAVKKGYTWFVENDVLFAKITPCMQNGKAAIARGLSNGVGFGSTEFHVLRPGADVLPEWIHLFIRQPSFREAAAQHFTGTVGQQRVPESFMASQELPLPPLSEQRRIVARIEELAGRIERARGLRRAAAEEVAAAQRASIERWFPDAPLAQWAPLAQVVEYIENGWSPQCLPEATSPGEWGVLKVGAVSTGRFVSHENKKLPPDLSPRPELEVRHGDFLMGRANTAELTGACAIAVNPPSRLLLCDKIFRFHFKAGAQIDTQYLDYAMKSKPLRRQIEAGATGTSSSMKNISKEKVLRLRLPLPPLDEQRRIVAYLDGVQARAEAVRRLQAESAADLAALLPAVLARAFRGEL